jgi:hypothetical protein
MPRIPIDATYGVQRSFEELNEELRGLKSMLDRMSTTSIQKSIEDLRKDVTAIQLLRRIPPPGQRAFTGAGPLFLNDRLNWSDVNNDVALGTVTVSRAVTGSDYILLVDCTAGNVTLTLPAASLGNRVLEFKKIDTTVNKVIITAAGSDTIEGDATLELLYVEEAVPIVSDGVSEWEIL